MIEKHGRHGATRPRSASGKRGLPPPARTSDRSGPNGTCRRFSGTDPETYAKAKAANKLTELPVNHSPKFAPVLHPTLQTGVEPLVVATRAWLPA